MPVLANPRHERFAQELAKGKTADEAYKLAGFRPHRGNASTLRANQNIIDRLRELHSRVADHVVVTRQRLVDEIAMMALAGLDHELITPQLKLKALNDLAVIQGWRVERHEVGDPGDFGKLNAEQLRQGIADRLERLGVVGRSDPPSRDAAKQGGLRGQLN